MLLVCVLGAIFLAACSSENKPAASSSSEQSKPVEKSDFQTGRLALQKLYTTARGWAGDAQPIRLESQYRKVEGAPAAAATGKAAIWRGSFASPRGARHALTGFRGLCAKSLGAGAARSG